MRGCFNALETRKSGILTPSSLRPRSPGPPVCSSPGREGRAHLVLRAWQRPQHGRKVAANKAS